jgi:uncharacterized damage-inducible protein DinB
MPDSTRTDLPADLSERSLLLTMLDYTRKTAVMKCEGLSDQDGRRSLLSGSPLMTVSGIISHLRWVEWSWIHVRLLGEDDPGPWTDDENDPDREMHFRLDWPLADVVADYQDLARSHDELFASLELDKVAAQRTRGGQEITFRWIVHHLIEENARHNGHLDIIREMLDGTTGD